MKRLLAVLLCCTFICPAQSLVGIIGAVAANNTVATPTDSPGQGTYSTTQSVTLSDATGSAVICYTTDGSTPGAATPGTCDGAPTQTYSTAISVSVTTTIKAIGTKVGLTNSGVLTSVYTISAGISSTPVHECNGQWASGNSFTLTCTAPTSGNIVILAANNSNTATTVSSISSTGVTWRGSAEISSNTTDGMSIWCGDVGAGAGTTITINLNTTGTGQWRANMSEWSGTNPCAAAIGAKAANTATATNPTTATITPTASKNVVMIATVRKSGSFTSGPTNSFVALGTPGSSAQFAYLVVPSTSGSYSTSWVYTTNVAYDALIATFMAP